MEFIIALWRTDIHIGVPVNQLVFKFPTAPTGSDRYGPVPCITGGQGSGIGGNGKEVKDLGLNRIDTAVAVADGYGIASGVWDHKGGPALVTASNIVLEGVLRLRTRGQG